MAKRHEIKEIVKIVLYDKKTGEILMEGKPTTQPIRMTVTNNNENRE
jgi:hypothetical protein